MIGHTWLSEIGSPQDRVATLFSDAPVYTRAREEWTEPFVRRKITVYTIQLFGYGTYGELRGKPQ